MYCKYCYGEHPTELGPDGSIIVCTNCGAGLGPVEPDEAELRDEYEDLEDRITENKWALADWLLEHVPNPGHGGNRRVQNVSTQLELATVAGWRGRSVNWLTQQRQMAEKFPPGKRDSRWSVSAHHEAWQKTKSPARALALLERKGGSTRALRGSKGDGIKTIMARSTEDQARIVAELLRNPKVSEQVVEQHSEALTETVAQSLAKPELSDAVSDRIHRSSKLSTQVAHNALTRGERQGQYTPPPRSREQVDAQRGEFNTTPPPPADPWTPFWQAMRSLDDVFDRMHPEAWDTLPEFNAQIALAADEKAELLRGLAEAAREKVVEGARMTPDAK